MRRDCPLKNAGPGDARVLDGEVRTAVHLRGSVPGRARLASRAAAIRRSVTERQAQCNTYHICTSTSNRSSAYSCDRCVRWSKRAATDAAAACHKGAARGERAVGGQRAQLCSLRVPSKPAAVAMYQPAWSEHCTGLHWHCQLEPLLERVYWH